MTSRLALVREISLRAYQSRAIDELRRKVAAKLRRIVLIAPTGSGKTVMGSEIIRSCVARNNRIIFIAHRRELIDQTVDKLVAFGISCGVVMASDARRDDFLPVQVCSVQTLARRMDRLPKADVVIVDECHHAASATWKSLIEAYGDAVVIGLTATPFRSDKLGLKDLFEDYVVAATPSELIEEGSLVRYDAAAYDAPELHEVSIVAGEFNQRELSVACNTDILVGSAVSEYLAHANGRPAICFPVSLEHSNHLVNEFRQAGVSAEHIDFKTAKPIRASALERFRRRELKVISSVGILTEGFDAPVAEVAILCRPTKSLALHLQMLGRVLRPAPGKDRALFHDHAGNILRHGLPDDPREWNIENTSQAVIRRKTCPSCCRFVTRFNADGTCPECGALVNNPADLCGKCGLPKATDCACVSVQRSGKRTVEGRRIDLDEIRRIRSEAGITREMSDAHLQKVACATREEKIAEYKRLALVARRKGFKEGFVQHQYRNVFGHWPRFSAEELASTDPAAKPFLPLPPRTNA